MRCPGNMRHMTKHKFQTLCEQVLIPQIGDLLHTQLTDILETQDTVARELIRMGDLLERTAAALSQLTDNADHR